MPIRVQDMSLSKKQAGAKKRKLNGNAGAEVDYGETIEFYDSLQQNGEEDKQDDDDEEDAGIDPYAKETADEKRLRLAKQYLDKLHAERDQDDDKTIDDDLIASRLQQDAVSQCGGCGILCMSGCCVNVLLQNELHRRPTRFVAQQV